MAFLTNDAEKKWLYDFRMKAFLGYSTPYSKWSEEIITLSDELVLKKT
jgi:hypothetical protein